MTLRLPVAHPDALPVPRWDFTRVVKLGPAAQGLPMTWNVDADDIFVIGSADGAVFELSISVTTPLFSEYVPVSGWLAQPVYAGEVVFVKNTATVWLVPLQKHAS